MIRSFLSVTQYTMLLLGFLTIPLSQAYLPPVEFQETFNNIITVQQVSDWSPGSARTITQLAMSGDGTRVAFKVDLNYCQNTDPVCWKLYVVNADGSGLIDLTPSSEITPITYLRMNQDGSRVFFRSPIFGNYTDIYYCDVDSRNCHIAVKDGLWGFDFRVPYSIDSTGENLYFKHDDGWDDVSQTYRRGLYTATAGGSKSRVMDISELPCDSECGNMNTLSFLGSSGSGSELVFAFNQDYWGGDATAMWGYSGSGAQRLDNTHDYVWDVQNIFGHMLSHDGRTALYSYTDYGDAETLNIVDMATLAVTQLASSENSGLVDSMAALSPDGRYARYQGHSYLTRVDRNDGSKRDLLSYSTKMRESLWSGRVSNFSENNQRYFILNLNETSGAKLVRADINSSASGDAPTISNIAFSAYALLHADGSTIGITANVNDLQGLNDIESVRLVTLVEGLEVPDFAMGREPLAFPAGDPGGTLLYDDGSHGDVVAGDGIFSFDAIATRKGDYDGWNTFYTQFSLPHAVGVRIVAKDKSQNYAIVDVPLTITDNPQDTVNPLLTQFIERLYENILGRASDAGGLAYWTNIIQTKSAAFVVQKFFYSQEFTNLNLNDIDFIDILYLTILDRASDIAGSNYWLSKLQDGKLRDMVLYKFLLSQEFTALADSYMINAFDQSDMALYQIKLFVVRFYELVLQRNPEVSGYNYWTEQLFNGTKSASNITIGFFFSNEFISQNHNDNTFVNIAYQTILNRIPDENGRIYWLGRLASGLTRLQLINGFIGSQEFKNLADSYGIRVY